MSLFRERQGLQCRISDRISSAIPFCGARRLSRSLFAALFAGQQAFIRRTYLGSRDIRRTCGCMFFRPAARIASASVGRKRHAAPRTILSLHRSSAVGAKIFVSCISMTISANHDRIKQTPCAIVFPPAAGRRGTSSPYYTAKETSIGISVRKPHLPDRRARIRLYPITAELYRPQLPVSDIIIQCQRAACKEEALYNLIRI